MAELAAYFQTLKSQTPCLEMDSIINNFTFSEHNPPFLMNFPTENSTLNQIQTMEFSRKSSVSADEEQNPLFLQMNEDTVKAELKECNSKRKRKPTVDMSERSCGDASSHIDERSKRRKTSEKEEKEPKEVVHVRARRGQATDRHSLAERVRRGKINERLKCLQNIVPGCYKSMGMAVMLDEIINYVQSLQNQVEFLSMKLASASSVYNFNSEQEMERLMRVGQGTNFSTATWQT